MKGHGQKLTRKQEALILALLTEPTYEAAAVKVGIGTTTLYRWLALPEFSRAYRDARRQAVEGAIAQLQQAMGDAVAALRRNLTCGKPEAENSAAKQIIDHALKGVEVTDLAERVAELEERINEPASNDNANDGNDGKNDHSRGLGAKAG